jgi:hypothetical protein
VTTGSPTSRYRCSTCGNLTRFDVTTNRRTRAFHHYTVGGELAVEDEVVLDERVESITCRWCGPSGAVEPVADDSVAGELAADGEGRS